LVVSGTVLNKLDELTPRARRTREQLVDEIADRVNDVEIPTLVMSANVVRLPNCAALEHRT
jgi:hypothetical protein